MTSHAKEPTKVPAGHPDPECNTGYAEPKPKDHGEAQIPGATPDQDPEEGGLDRDADPES